MRISNQLHRFVWKIVLIVLLLSIASLVLTMAIQEQNQSQAKSLVKASKHSNALTAFLAAPIDLFAFKKNKGPSNSGSFKANSWIHRPNRPGFFYQYMMFNTPTQYSEGERFYGFSNVVYKFGKDIGDYYDHNDALVAIWSRLNDPDLGQANLVGRSVFEIKARFGETFDSVGDILIYYHHRRALSIHTKDGIVDWFKYVRLSRDIDKPEAVPKILLQPGFGR